MAAVFAERERSPRELEPIVELHSSGTGPAESVDDEVGRHVETLFDEIEEAAADRADSKSLPQRVSEAISGVFRSKTQNP